MEDLDTVATFRWCPAGDHWRWDPALFRLHGHEPGEAVPSRALLLAHVHPDDRDRVDGALTALARADLPFRTRHRVVATGGAVREVVAIGGLVGREVRGWVVPVDTDLGAPALAGPLLPAAAAEVAIPVPRGRDGAGPAARVSPLECTGEIVLPVGRPGEEDAVDTHDAAERADDDAPTGAGGAGGVADAHHAAVLRRAHDTLVTGLDLTRGAAAGLVAWLANTHEVPPVIVAESLAAVGHDRHGHPDLASLLAVLDGGPSD